MCVTHTCVSHIHVCHTYMCVTHTCVSHIHVCHTYMCVTHTCVSYIHDTRSQEHFPTHILLSHVTHVIESCHTWVSRVTPISKSPHTRVWHTHTSNQKHFLILDLWSKNDQRIIFGVSLEKNKKNTKGKRVQTYVRECFMEWSMDDVWDFPGKKWANPKNGGSTGGNL